MSTMKCAVLVVLLAGPAARADQAVFQQGSNGYEGSEDTWLRTDYVYRSYGAHNYLRVQHKGGSRDQSLIKFTGIFGPESGQVPLGGQIDSAMLRLFHYVGDATGAIAVYPLRVDVPKYGTLTGDANDGEACFFAREYWDEGNFTPWGTDNPGNAGPVDGEDIDMAAEVLSGTISQGEWAEVDITDIVRDWYGGAMPNYGLVLRAQSGTYINFWAGSNTPSPDLRPELVIDYGSGSGCNPGDADNDGDVDDDDLSLLLANWGKDTDCAHGEFSGVAPVNDDDLSLLLANWTGSLRGAVPEPATGGVLLLAGLCLLRRRRT